MACSLSYIIDEIKALVEKLIDKYIVCQKAIIELAVQFDNASTTKEDLRKAYEKCNAIPQENRALINTFFKQECDKDYEMRLLLGIGVPPETINQGASLIGCGVLHTPFNYLGVSVGNLMSRHSAWTSVIQKLRARLSNWKVKTLSIGGRLTLLKSVLGASPRIVKISWVAWDKTLASKKKGGLGISSFHALNRALLLKWVWRFISQDGSFWSKVISVIYGSSIGKELGYGQNTKFWRDVGTDIPFRLLFPRLFALEVDKEASVASKMDHPRWLILSWFCDLNGDGVFRVRDVRISIDDLLLPSSGRPTRWVKFIPIKIQYLFMAETRARIVFPLGVILLFVGVLMDSSLCPLCGLVSEDVAHVLFRCEVSQHILRKICRWRDLVWFDVLNFSEWDGCVR
ncbi:hypothetical protein Tco_0721432 [Tanacetum coccineum]